MSFERLTAKEVADMLGVTNDTVYKMVRQKEIPHFRVRRTILFSKQSIIDWIAEQEEESIKQNL